MHRRVIKSLVPLVGAAALVAVPLALAAPASAAPIMSAVLVPDDTMPFDEDRNHEGYWEDFLWEEEGIEALCVKEPEEESESNLADPYTIPEIDELFEAEEGVELEYALAVLKGGAGQDPEKDAHELYWWPEAGDQLSHTWYGNSHVILCATEVEPEEPEVPEEETPTKPKPPVKGPVVETDRVADTGSAAGLGLAAAATVLVAGAGVLVVSRRRQGDHR